MLVRAVATIAIAALALLAAGCGGGDDGDPGQILEETFSNDQSIDSGVLDISLDAGASGEQGGTVTASLGGPFQSRESDQLPLVDFDLSLQVDDGGAGTDFEGGALITADGAYISSAGQAYEVDEQTFTTFTESYAQSARARDEQTEEGSAIFDRLGVDPATWLTDVTNEGTEEVGGVETTHISGDADVAQIIEDAQRLDDLTGSAAGAGSGELADSVRSASVDVFTGVDDRLLRRLVLDLELEDPGQSDATINFALSIEISDLNAEQSFEAPADARPIDELIPGGLGAIGAGGLGALGGAPGAGSGGAGGGGSGGGGGGGSGGGGLGGLDALETNPEYVECLQNASSPEAVDECNDLL